jgi:hypothetical protein
MPRGRGLEGAKLLASDESPWMTWVRSGRDGISYLSTSDGLITDGASEEQKLARPRVRELSLLEWLQLMAQQAGYALALSDDGRRARLLASMWGSRALLTEDLSGPMVKALFAFRPESSSSSGSYGPGEGVVLSGRGGHLTFRGFRRAWHQARADDVVVIRDALDRLISARVVRRGLILGCAECGQPAFIVISELDYVVGCPRCGSANSLSRQAWKLPAHEPQWFYDLHPAARELIDQNGYATLWLSQHLRSSSRHYIDVAEAELRQGEKPVAEADLVALADGQLITAEVKTAKGNQASLGNSLTARTRSAHKRVLLAETLRADEIILATTVGAWEQLSVDAVAARVRERRNHLPPGAHLRLISGLGTDVVQDVILDDV